MSSDLTKLLTLVGAFREKAHQVLAVQESSQASRVVSLEQSYKKLTLLNVEQDDLIRQALRCTENGLYRAAHVMSWAACMDFIQQKLAEDGMIAVRTAYPRWPKTIDIHELAEYIPERQLVEALKTVGLLTKNQVGALISLLQRRNECAHPTGYYPGLNETLGYISEIMNRLTTLSKRHLTVV